MIANLPLLFANGNPIGLSKITSEELERFITFMVTCSWGHDTAKEIVQPPWWPADVKFSHPFVRTKDVPEDWAARLKKLVKKCYDYHKSAFLLVFSGQLARYPRKRLRYVDNRDHTTSLYYRPSGRLLVTFRNENLYYDRSPPAPRPVLVPMAVPMSVPVPALKPAPALTPTPVHAPNIYLCDSCDSHFDNLDKLRVHERLCNANAGPAGECNGGLADFIGALKLQPVGVKSETMKTPIDSEIKSKNGRSTANIDRGPPYPFSSLAYTRNARPVQRDTAYSRERIERYCCTTTLPSKNVGNKLKLKNQQFPVRYRRPIDYWNRKHVFPQQRNKKILDLKAQLFYLKCRPVSVNVERLSMARMMEMAAEVRRERAAERERAASVVVVDDVEEEVIDLCSDSEGSVEAEEPRGAVACVMRGGAVLRRTGGAATPRALPADPCGATTARQQHYPPPHPVILITHTLNSLQTISLE